MEPEQLYNITQGPKGFTEWGQAVINLLSCHTPEEECHTILASDVPGRTGVS